MPDKPRNGGQWTEARFKGFIISALRSASQRWGPKNQCIREARVSRGLYKCDGCGKIVSATLPPPPGKKRRIKNIVADHIEPVVDPRVGFVDWNTYIARMFVEREGYQALCHDCHTKKSEKERELAKERRGNNNGK